MVRRYAHLAADHLAAYVGIAQIHRTFLAHRPTLPKLLDERLSGGQAGIEPLTRGFSVQGRKQLNLLI